MLSPDHDLSDLSATFTWLDVARSAAREAVDEPLPSGCSPAELLDRICLPLVEADEMPCLWILLENEATQRRSHELVEAIASLRATALSWLARHIEHLQEVGFVSRDWSADDVAATVLMELDALWAITAREEPGARRARYDASKATLLARFAPQARRAA